MTTTATVAHVAGLPIVIEGRARQRCAWCGALLLDVDWDSTEGIDADPPPAWTDGHWIVVATGGRSGYDAGSIAEQPVPAHACAALDPEVIR